MSRQVIDSYLSEISAAIGKQIRLNDQGICAFTYEQLTIVIEVPETVASFFVYTTLASAAQTDNPLPLFKKAMQMNYLQQETRGGCLALDPINDEVVFSYTDRCEEVNATDFRNILENFIDTALKLHEEMNNVLHGTPAQAAPVSAEGEPGGLPALPHPQTPPHHPTEGIPAILPTAMV